jgi:hypothetical protein
VPFKGGTPVPRHIELRPSNPAGTNADIKTAQPAGEVDMRQRKGSGETSARPEVKLRDNIHKHRLLTPFQHLLI